jgi:hypothetical protein
MGIYEISLIIVAIPFLGLYVHGLFSLIRARRRAEAIKPLSRAARA